MTFPHSPQPGPRPGPPPGGFRPGPPPSPPRPAAEPSSPPLPVAEAAAVDDDGDDREPGDTGHPAVDAALRSLDNAAALTPGEQIAAFEAAHQVLQETLASIDR